MVNGIGVIEGSISMPRVGRWTADVTLDDGVAPTGEVTVTSGDGKLNLKGTVRRGGSYVEVGHVHLVAGHGGLENTVEPVYYRSVTLGTPLRALLGSVGEVLSSTTDAGVLNKFLERWTREKGPGGPSLSRLADAAGATWRVLDDGAVWLGTDTFPDSGVTEDTYELLSESPAEFRATLATEQIPSGIRPGTSFRGSQVAFVEYRVARTALTTQVWYERNAPSSHPVLGPLQGIIRDTMRDTRYHAEYPGRVFSQNADDSLDIRLDDESFPHMTQVPMEKFAPGIKVRVATGARVMIGFEAGDPSRPVARLFSSGVTTEIPVKTCGSLHMSAQGNVLTAAYTSPDGATTLETFTFVYTGSAIVITAGPANRTMNLSGRIAT